MNGHFGLAGAYHEDPGAFYQRLHRDDKAKNDRIDRTLTLIREKLAGRTFTTFEGLCGAARVAISAASQRAVTDEEYLVLVAACRLTWAGFIQPGIVTRTMEPITVTFKAA